MNKSRQKALSGLRVLDLSRVLSGPFCTMILADLGAEVIKIEMPKVGNDTRTLGPFVKGESMYFVNMNRNKYSLTLDLKKDEGKQVFLDLVKKSDVVVENFKPSVMKKLGLDYEILKSYNPRIICASISGFGQTSKYAERAGYDIIGQAMGGIMSCTGWPDKPPSKVGTPIADILAGLFTTIGILASVIARNEMHKGQNIDVALVDSVISSLNTLVQIYLVTGKVPERVGNRYLFMAPFNTFKVKDGWVVIGIGNYKLWRKFCEVLQREDLKNLGKYSSNKKRVEHYEELEKLVNDWIKDKSKHKVTKLLLENGIPASLVYDVEDIVNDENIVKDREMLVEMQHPTIGKIKVVGSPIKMSETPPAFDFPAPLLGQQTKDILKNLLGYPDEKIEYLEKNSVI